jgi:hypothetical protein
MISQFPNFSKLDASFQQEIEAFTSQFKPYSDFNFVSLFSWDVDETAKVAMLNGNLVISLPDYITGNPVYSILGDGQIDESLKALLSAVGGLTLVPKDVVEHIENKALFKIDLDRDNFDYVYSVEEHATLAGKKFLAKRKKYNRFANQFGNRIQIRDIDPRQPNTKSQITTVVKQWIESKNRDESESTQEKLAISRLIDHADIFNLVGVAIDLDDHTVGFSLYEILHKGYSLSHFHKTDPKFPNSDVFLTCEAAKMLLKNGYSRVNWEQDMGLEGLRKSKLSYKPVEFLEKYRISLAI